MIFRKVIDSLYNYCSILQENFIDDQTDMDYWNDYETRAPSENQLVADNNRVAIKFPA